MTSTTHIVLIGPTPPLIGGVCTHVNRASHLFDRVENIKVRVLSSNASTNKLRSLFTLLRMPITLLARPAGVVHIHVDSLPFLVIGFLASIKHKVYLTVHNNRYPSLYSDSSISTAFRWRLMKAFDKIVAVNSDTKEFLDRRLKNVYEEVLPAFLPPQHIEESSIDFIRDHFNQGNYDTMLAGYAYRLSFYQNQDLYGVDMMAELVKQLVEQGKNPLLVLMLNLTPNAYLNTITERIATYNLKNNILLVDITKGVDSVAVWKQADVYLRPTNTDGDSVALREALHVGTHVVASNCTFRPDGVVLFQNRDQNDFLAKTLEVLNAKPIKATQMKSFRDTYALLYGIKR